MDGDPDLQWTSLGRHAVWRDQQIGLSDFDLVHTSQPWQPREPDPQGARSLPPRLVTYEGHVNAQSPIHPHCQRPGSPG